MLGPDHPDVATSLNNLATLYQDRGQYSEAESSFRRSFGIREKALGPSHLDVANSLSHVGSLYLDQGRYSEAEPLLRRSLEIRERALGRDHPNVALSLNTVAQLFHDQGRLGDAEALYRRSLDIREKALGPNHPDVGDALNNLALLYKEQGRYAEAEPLYQRSLAILERALGPDHPAVALSLNNLAGLYRVKGRHADVEPLLRRSLRIGETALGPDHPYVGASLNNLAALYKDQGRYAEAETLYRRSLAIVEKARGPDHRDVATFLNNLAELYQHQGRYADAEPLLRRSLSIVERALGTEHLDVATSLNNLALLYAIEGQYGDAERLLQRSLGIWERGLGPNHVNVATTLNNLAELYRAQDRFGEAEPLFRRSVQVLEATLGPDHLSVAVPLSNLAGLFYARGKRGDAEPLFDRILENLARQSEYHFTYMTERERLAFLETVSSRFDVYFSFCFAFRDENPALRGKMYDTLLWRKGFIAASLAALRSRVEATGDNNAVALLEKLSEKRTRLAQLMTARPGDPTVTRERIAELDREAQAIENELVRRVSTLAEEKRLARATWRDVQKGLKPGEAAVEIVRFDFHDGKSRTGKSYYVALIVTPETRTAPSLVLLGEAQEVEGAGLGDYRERVRRPETRLVEHEEATGPREEARPAAWAALWKPLEPALSETRRVYLAADGRLHQVAWGLLAREDGRLLLESVDLHLVSSTKDLLRAPRASGGRGAVLVGNPRFDLADTEQRRVAQRLSLASTVSAPSTRSLRSRDQLPARIVPLPATRAEVDSLRLLFQAQAWPVEVLTEENALEEAVKRLKAPRVLHLATHGFFLSDQETPKERGLSHFGADVRPPALEDPMLRSGIVLAGAERGLSGEGVSPDLEDGVLTAYEAMGLNLHGTELVTLSACETGLGDVKTGEGVFGLRRALEVAGAEAVLMSLWAVPDRETQELMSSFYRRWLSGQDKHEALRDAQIEMRQTVKTRYGCDLPYYWGAFVLVGR